MADTPITIRSVADARQILGSHADGMSDQQILSVLATASGQDPTHVANTLGWGATDAGVNSNRLRSAGNDSAASLWGVGEAAAGAVGLQRAGDWMAQRRQNDELSSQIQTQRAQDQGGVENLSDVHGAGDLGSFVLGQGVRAVPTLAAMAAGAFAAPETGGASLAPILERVGVIGTRAALSEAGAAAADATAQNVAKGLAGAAATYPQSVGDLLQAQRQSGNGQTDLAAAAIGGVPMAALNAVGPENTLARGQLFHNGIAALDDIGGVRGLLTRTAASAGQQAAVGAGQAAAQELVTQAAGRMPVDPNQQMWSDVEMGRVGSAALTGGLVGGAMGGALGGWRKSGAGEPTPGAADDPGADLLNRGKPAPAAPPLQLGHDAGPTYFAHPDGSVSTGPDARDAHANALWQGQFQPQDAGTHDGTIDFADPQFEPQPAAPAAPQPGLDFTHESVPQGPQPGPATHLQIPDVNPQGDLFGGTGVAAPAEGGSAAAGEPAAPAAHPTSQPDLFATTPTAAVRTDFATGPVLNELRQANGGKIDQYTSSVAQMLSDELGGGQASEHSQALRDKYTGGAESTGLVDQLREKLETAKLTQATIDQRLKVLDAAQAVVDRYHSRMTDAATQEAAQRDPAAVAAAQAPDAEKLGQNVAGTVTEPGNATEMAMRQANADREARGQAAVDRAQEAARQEKITGATADTDARVQAAEQQRAAEERRQILDKVIGDPETRNPTGRFTAALKKLGITDTSIHPEEAARISRFHDIQEALKDNKDVPHDVIPSSPNELDPYAKPPEKDAAVHGSVSSDQAPREGKAPKAKEDLKAQADESSAALQRAMEQLSTAKDEKSRAGAAQEAKVAKTITDHDQARVDEAPSKKPEGPTRMERADLQHVDRSVEKYNSAKRPDDALMHARSIHDEAKGSPSKLVRDHAQKAFDEHVDPLTKKQVEEEYHGDALDRQGLVTGDAKMLDAVKGAKTASDALTAAANLPHGTPEQKALLLELAANPALKASGFTLGKDTIERKLGGVLGTFRAKERSLNLNHSADLETLIHEATHAATIYGLGEHFNVRDGFAPKTELGREMHDFFNRVRSKLGGVAEHYGLKNIAEFVAEAQANPDFRDALRALPEGKSILQRLKEFVGKLLGIESGPARTALDQAMEFHDKFSADNAQGMARRFGEDLGSHDKADTYQLPEPEQHGAFSSLIKGLNSSARDWRNRPWTLGMYTMRQLTDRFKGNDLVKRHTDAHFNMHAEAEHSMHDSNGVINGWKNLQAETQKALGKVMLEATLNRVNPDLPFTDQANAHLRTDDTHATAQAASDHTRIAQMYNALPKSARDVFNAARKDGQRQWQGMHDALAERIVSAYEPALKGAFSHDELTELVKSPRDLQGMMKDGSKEAGLPYAQRAALRSMIEDAQVRADEAAQLKGPYFPLVRNGDHVVTAKSPSLKRVQDTFTAKRDHLQALYDAHVDEANQAEHDNEIAKARREMNEARSSLELLKGEDKHYSVTFFENRWEAEAYQRKLAEDPATKTNQLDVQLQQRAEYSKVNDAVTPNFVRQAENELRKVLPGSDFGKVQDAMREVYLRTLPDRSALKSELRRMNVPGARSTEMMRGFAARSMGNAWRVSRMKYNGEIMDTLKQLRESGNRDNVLLGNEFSKRLANSMNPPAPNALFRNLANISHLTTLGLSPSYLISQVVQPWVISAPIMAGRHGWLASGNHLADASGEVMKVISAERAAYAKELSASGDPLASLKSWRFNLQPDQLGKTDGEKSMIKELFNNGLIDITVEHDLSSVARGGDGAFSRGLATASKVASTPAYVTEAVNRATTALAAYRMEVKKGSGHDVAMDYAKQIVADTHLDYTAANAPRLMRSSAFGGLGQLLFQFKRFSQGMMYLQAKLIKNSLDANLAPKERAEHAKAFAYLNGLTFAAAGASGLPLAGGIGLAFQALQKLWASDDQPEIGEQLYEGLKDGLGEKMAQALVKGLPAAAGVDLSHRFGMGELSNPTRLDLDAKLDKDMFSQIALGLSGPAMGMLANWADAYDAARTDPMHAWEKVLPTVVANPLKAFDRSERGIVSKSGKEVVAQQEFGATEAVLRSLGYESTNVTDTMERRVAFNAAEQRITDARSTLLRNFVDATLGGRDTGGVMDRITAFNSRNPMNRIDASELGSGISGRVKANATSVGGIPVYQPKSLDALSRIQ